VDLPSFASPGDVVGAICGYAPLRCNRALAADWVAARLLAVGLLLGVVFLVSSRHVKLQSGILHKCHVAACHERWVLFLQHCHLHTKLLGMMKDQARYACRLADGLRVHGLNANNYTLHRKASSSEIQVSRQRRMPAGSA
jgi:hypothetical protein